MIQNYWMSGAGANWLPVVGILVPILILWTLFWKGLALWHSGRRGEGWWFFFLLILNTAGILEIIYLFAVAKVNFSQLFSKGPIK